jgi:two-component system cell cycle sensor histidine kinase/response regulator CckA
MSAEVGTRPVPVLVVDDDSAIIRTLADILRLHGFAPETATSATEGLVIAKRQLPALAVIDLGLPDMDGMQLAARLHELSAQTEVVVLTGNATMENAIAALREHSLDFLLKPVDVDYLLRVATLASERWQRRQAEDRVAESEQRFRRVFESPMLGMTLWKGEELREANDAFFAMVGFDRKDADNQRLHPSALMPPERQGTYTTMRDKLRVQRQIAPYEAELLGKNGVRVPVIVGAARLDGDDDETVAFFLDISDRKKAEHALLQAQRLETTGRIAAGVAHDFNNVLTVINGFADLVHTQLPADHALQGDIAEIRKAADRGVRLTRQLLSLGTARPRKRQSLQLSSVVDDMHRMLRQIVGPYVDVRLTLDAHLPVIGADRSQVEQVILNLCVNARDAMPAGGVLAIKTSSVQNDGPSGTTGPSGHWAMLSVSDSGFGMSEETQKHIFDPFFTTKTAEKGTGLGLATVHEIVTKNGGAITVHSFLGGGATFCVFFPYSASGD